MVVTWFSKKGRQILGFPRMLITLPVSWNATCLQRGALANVPIANTVWHSIDAVFKEHCF